MTATVPPARLRARDYRRVSTNDEDQDSSLVNQAHINSAYIESKGWEHTGHYSDRQTGTTLQRDGLQQAVADLRAGKFDVLVAKDLSRFARTIDFLHLLRDIQDAGGHVAIIGLGVDTTTSFGRLVIGILLLVFQSFAERTGELIEASYKAKRERGEHIGHWPWALEKVWRDGSGKGSDYYWRIIKDDEDPAKDMQPFVLRVFADSKGGLSANKIALWLNEQQVRSRRGGKWTATTVVRILRHPLYRDLLPAGLWEDAQPATIGRRLACTEPFLFHRLLRNDYFVYAPHMSLQGSVQMAAHADKYPSYVPYLPNKVPGKPSFVPVDGAHPRAAKAYPPTLMDRMLIKRLIAFADADPAANLLADAQARYGEQREILQARADALKAQLEAQQRRLKPLLARVDSAIDMGLQDRAVELDAQARALAAAVAGLEAEAAEAQAAALVQELEFTPAAEAFRSLNLIRELWNVQAWPELRRLLKACIRAVHCRLYRKKGKRQLHGEIRIVWKDVLVLPDSATSGIVSSAKLDDTFLKVVGWMQTPGARVA